MRDIAVRLLHHEPQAYHDALLHAAPFADSNELGTRLVFAVPDAPQFPGLVQVMLRINSEKVIPQEIKSLLQSGKLSVKKMPQSRFYARHQDHVCSCVLRIAREMFALLPTQMVIITAAGGLLNTQTGYVEKQALVSAAIPRPTVQSLNFDSIDPRMRCATSCVA